MKNTRCFNHGDFGQLPPPFLLRLGLRFEFYPERFECLCYHLLWILFASHLWRGSVVCAFGDDSESYIECLQFIRIARYYHTELTKKK